MQHSCLVLQRTNTMYTTAFISTLAIHTLRKRQTVSGFESRGGYTEEEGGGTSWCNAKETAVVLTAVQRLLQGGDVAASDIGVITPYAAQVRLLSDALRQGLRSTSTTAAATAAAGDTTDSTTAAATAAAATVVAAAGATNEAADTATRSAAAVAAVVSQSQQQQKSGMSHRGESRTRVRPSVTSLADSIEARSVDGYQGREKQVIVLSAVRSNARGSVGFLSDWRRLNVAITRAKRGVVIVGDPRTLRNDPHWSAYMQWCKGHGVIVSAESLFPVQRSSSSSSSTDTDSTTATGTTAGTSNTDSSSVDSSGDSSGNLQED
jgi:AAA domain